MKNIILNVALLATTSLWCMEEKIIIEKKDKPYAPKVTFKIENEKYTLKQEKANRSEFIKEMLTLEHETSKAIPLPHITKDIWTKYIFPALKRGKDFRLVGHDASTDDFVNLVNQSNFLNIPHLYKQAVIGLSTAIKSELLDEKKLLESLPQEVQEHIAPLLNNYMFMEKYYEKFGNNNILNYDGSLVALSNNTGYASVTRLKTRENCAHLWGFVTSFAFHPHKNILVTSSKEGKIEVWDIDNKPKESIYAINNLMNRPIDAFKDRDIRMIFFSPDGSLLATMEKHETSNKVTLRNLETKETISVTPEHDNPIIHIALNYDGTELVSICQKGIIKFWHTKTGKLITTMSTAETSLVTAAAYSVHGKYVAVGFQNGTIMVYNLHNKHAVKIPEPTSTNPLESCAILSIDINNNETVMVSVSSNGGYADLWDLTDKTVYHLQHLSHPHSCIMSAKFSADGSRLITTSFDTSVRIWAKRFLDKNLATALYVHKTLNSGVLNINNPACTALNNDQKKFVTELFLTKMCDTTEKKSDEKSDDKMEE
jgi:WD40 repeat protein